MAKTPDPIFAALDLFKKKDRLFDRLWDELDGGENDAVQKHGKRPWGISMWRGWTNVEAARAEFLRKHVASPEQIERLRAELRVLRAR